MTEAHQARLYPGLNLGSKHASSHPGAEKVLFGFWVFLMVDALTFALFFAIYGTTLNPLAIAGGPGPQQLFDLSGTALETALLLLSSLSCGVCSLVMKHQHHDQAKGDNYRLLIVWLAVTALLGAGFLAHEMMSFVDYSLNQNAPPQRSGWLSAFYALLGLHGLHVFAGCVWIAVLIAQLTFIGLNHRVKTNIMRWALFWHFLDIVWIFIFSFVFLAGLSG